MQRATQNIVGSPTIHASLETDLHRSGMDLENEIEKHNRVMESSGNGSYNSPFEKVFFCLFVCLFLILFLNI